MSIVLLLLISYQTPLKIGVSGSTTTERPVIRMKETIEVAERQSLILSKRPKLGEKIKAFYEITPKNSVKDLKVIFYGFQGVKPIRQDTAFNFNAKKGVSRKFTIYLEYVATPATFKVRIAKAGKQILNDRLSLTRYLINTATGEYGSIKELQYNPPIEYRFNPNLRKFEQEVFRFEKDRWQKNRGIIDTVKTFAPSLSDSFCLLLYADIPKISYPREIAGWQNKAEYLLKQGWQDYIDEIEREVFLNDLKIRNEEKQKKLMQEEDQARKIGEIKWLLSWLIPVILLSLLCIYLLILNRKRRNKVVTQKPFDKVITYLIYIVVIGITLYFTWPYLGLKRKKVDKTRENAYKALAEIEHQSLLSDLKEFKLIGKSILSTSSGFGGIFRYKDTKHSKIDVEYFFSIMVYPTKQGYDAKLPSYAPEEAIKRFEENKRVFSFLLKIKIKKALLKFRGASFSVTLYDTIIKSGKKIPIYLEYDGNKDLIISYIVPSDFEDPNFSEIKRLKQFCERTGHRVKQDTYIRCTIRSDYYHYPGLATLVEDSGNDTLWIWFFSEKPSDFTFRWIPVPRVVKPPQSIIDQLYSEFEGAGLTSEYVKNHLKIISIRGLRKPNYFGGKGDRVILEATLKWLTEYDWVDEINNGQGAQFNVSYEYFANSPQRGLSSEKFYLRPIKQIISKKEARVKLFKFLPDEKKFDAIHVQLKIPQKPLNLGNFIYLVGTYTPPTRGCISYSYSIKVDLETGEVLPNNLVR